MLSSTEHYELTIEQDVPEDVAPSPCYGVRNRETGIIEHYDVVLPRIYEVMHSLQERYTEMVQKENGVSLALVKTDTETEH